MPKDVDIAKLEFTSLAQPTVEDDALWQTLTPEQQRECIDHTLSAAQLGAFLSAEESREFMESLVPKQRVIQA